MQSTPPVAAACMHVCLHACVRACLRKHAEAWCGCACGGGNLACSLLRVRAQLKTSLQNSEVVLAPPVKEAGKLLSAYVKNVAESCREFVRWMDGTCLEMPDQRPKGDGDPLVMHFSSEVLRMQEVRAPAMVAAKQGCRQPCVHAALHAMGRPCAVYALLRACALAQVMAAAVQVHQAISKLSGRLNRHVEGWGKYADIWKADRVGLLDKFKAREPPASAFEEKFSKFQKVRAPAAACACLCCLA